MPDSADYAVEFDPETQDGPADGGRLDEAAHPPEPTPTEPADAGDGDTPAAASEEADQ